MYRLSNEFFAYNNRFNARGGWGTAVMTAGSLKCKARRTPLRVTRYLAPPHNRLAKKKYYGVRVLIMKVRKLAQEREESLLNINLKYV